MAKQQVLRIRLQAYDHKIIDVAAEKIVEVANKTGAKVIGPVPLPTEKQVYTILRATFKYKDSREQFEIRTHKRLIDIVNPTKDHVSPRFYLPHPTVLLPSLTYAINVINRFRATHISVFDYRVAVILRLA